jgi:energy-coupling factor transporter ATP-binding protein EcfA2
MAGLSHAEVEDILAVLFALNEQGITIVLIEHIMRAVMSFSTRLVVLVAARRSPTARRRRSCATPRSRGPILANSAPNGSPMVRGKDGLTISGLSAGYGRCG